MISHLGPQMGVADGIALANKLKKNGKVIAVFTGEGATSEGDFHEALNIAAVWDLPVLFVIENNGYGLSTPTNEQYRCENLADKGIGYTLARTNIHSCDFSSGSYTYVREGDTALKSFSIGRERMNYCTTPQRLVCLLHPKKRIKCTIH